MDLVCKVLRVKYNKDFIFFSRNPNPICNFPEMYVYFYNLLSKIQNTKASQQKTDMDKILTEYSVLGAAKANR